MKLRKEVSEMLSERERRQFDEIVRALRDDSEPDVPEPLPPAASVSEKPPVVGRWRRVVLWAERRFEQRHEAIVSRTNRKTQ